MVLELAHDDDVAGAEVREPPRVRDEVDRLGRIADENDLAHVWRVHERAHLLAGPFERRRGALREDVDAAMHVRVGRRIEVGHALEHLAGLLRAGGGVEEGERLAVDQLLEDWKIGAERPRVESLRSGWNRHASMVRISEL